MQRGFFAVGIYMPKTDSNVGTLLRSAFQMGASFTFTIGRPTKIRAASNTVKSYRHMPHFIYETFEDFQAHRPYGAPLVGIEMGGVPLHEAKHPESAIYLLGREDNGLPESVQKECQFVLELPSVRVASFNVAVSGSIVLYDRHIKNLMRVKGDSRG